MVLPFYSFFAALGFESHQSIKEFRCISEMSPLAWKNWFSRKSVFSNFSLHKTALNMQKHRTFVRCFRCCIFHQHILVRAWGLEPQRRKAREPKGDVTSVKDYYVPLFFWRKNLKHNRKLLIIASVSMPRFGWFDCTVNRASLSYHIFCYFYIQSRIIS